MHAFIAKIPCFRNANCNLSSSKLISTKTLGGLIKPNEKIIKIVNVTEKILSQFMKEKTIWLEKKCRSKIADGYFKNHRGKRIEMDWDISHPDDPSIGLIHSVILMKKIVAVYVSIRLKHYCKLYRHMYLDKNIRKNMTKTILFNP